MIRIFAFLFPNNYTTCLILQPSVKNGKIINHYIFGIEQEFTAHTSDCFLGEPRSLAKEVWSIASLYCHKHLNGIRKYYQSWKSYWIWKLARLRALFPRNTIAFVNLQQRRKSVNEQYQRMYLSRENRGKPQWKRTNMSKRGLCLVKENFI